MTREFYERYFVCHGCNGIGYRKEPIEKCSVCQGRRRVAIPMTELFCELTLVLDTKFKVTRL